jgi:ABC-type Fe3+ transport system permease subunit
MLFLFALSRQSGATPNEMDAREWRRVRSAAIIAAGASALDLVVGTVERIVYSGFAHPQKFIYDVVFSLPWMIAPLIVYVSLRSAGSGGSPKAGYSGAASTIRQ